jgi:antitoxin component of MazEF toxin-antitoxin module
MVRFFRKLIRTARGHHSVSLPMELVAAIGMEFGGPVSLDVENGKIIIAPVKVITQ